MTMFEVGQWMVKKGISMGNHPGRPSVSKQREQKVGTNPAIKIDLRRYLRTDHPELHRRGISGATCRYLGCGFLPKRTWTKKASPLNARLVFQVRGLIENGNGLQPVILTHTGRALSLEQEDRNGKYWSYPFKKSWEIYNQDHILLDEEARRQTKTSGLILTEGFFDVAKLVEAGLRNVVALMGSSISLEQIKRLLWIQERVHFPRIFLFPDRDKAGQNGFLQIRKQLSGQGFSVTMFEWDQQVSFNGHGLKPIPESIVDPADMSVEQLQTLHRKGII
jgi:DNA primase